MPHAILGLLAGRAVRVWSSFPPVDKVLNPIIVVGLQGFFVIPDISLTAFKKGVLCGNMRNSLKLNYYSKGLK